MALLIDAYNVLHCTHVLPDRFVQIGATGLCKMIDQAGVRGRVRVICDGAPPKEVESNYSSILKNTGIDGVGWGICIGDVALIYAGGGKDADSLIEKMIAQDSAPRDLIVVSNDRRIIAAAKKRKCTPLASEAFLHRLASALRSKQTPRQEKPTDEPDPDYWLRKFSKADDEGKLTPDELAGETEYWLKEFGFEE